MNKIAPKSLLLSKWTKTHINNKEKHFSVVSISFDEDQRVVECVIQAVINHNEYMIDWRELKDSSQWKIGWK
ncbi:TIGR02450 family Trp-rich protein [Thalassotalea hakodatensis]|uniref:TIGR02450 family Trp-rich protein n=1 Tax=Thalassotalea hakodatensis TaxID=3030492 RepID=UPI002573F855|nr:TIGR02450 family Trp-rich protein [Thalassotalea hakodatensis]